MIGYIVCSEQVSPISFDQYDVISENNIEIVFFGIYLHRLFRNEKDAYEELKREMIVNKLAIETKLNNIEQKLKELK